jgi:hypothetical protein
MTGVTGATDNNGATRAARPVSVPMDSRTVAGTALSTTGWTDIPPLTSEAGQNFDLHGEADRTATRPPGGRVGQRVHGQPWGNRPRVSRDRVDSDAVVDI